MQNRVAQLRREQNMLQKELARRVGVSRQSIIAIEKGRSVPSLEVALRIARCFAVPVETVFLSLPNGRGFCALKPTAPARLLPPRATRRFPD